MVQSEFTGIAGNKNISAASLCIKLPLIFYLIINSKKVIYKIFLYFILLLSFLVIFYLNSRATFISFFIINLFMMMILVYKKRVKTIFLFLVVFFLSLILNLNSPFFKSSNVLDRASSIEFSQEGSSGRFELWSNAIDYISLHPLVGCGIGNWKIQSLPYWKDRLTGYIVPYHAHNDFLELTAELGIIGGLSYLFIFISLLLLLFPRCRLDINLNNPKIYLLLVLMVYTVDSFFNFPLERPLIQIYFIVLFSLTYLLNNKFTSRL
jgi:O-antigen ligase